MRETAREDADRTPGSSSAVVETHTAWVVFLGDRAYKLKKPVRLAFLDFSTRVAREAAARREVELNRRLAPDVYLGVADVIGPGGDVCDHLVVMRRMPDDRRLAALVRAGALLDDAIRDVARVVAAFHTRARRSAEIDEAGAPGAVAGKVRRDLVEMRTFVGDLLDAAVLSDVDRLVRRYLAGRERLLEHRVATGCICDGHGDLLADDIFCLADGPRILDCIEFDDRLRYGDVLADVAFLAMDLERLGAAPMARRFLEAYEEFSNAHHPASLVHFYVAFRALIRSKVACLRACQGDRSARSEASSLLALARAHLARARVRLVLVGGPPGTGKSTLAAGMGDRLGWVVLRSDEVRKDVTGLGHRTRVEAPVDAGIYDPATTERTYRTLLDRARHALEMGESTVLDASWSDARWRDAAARVARETTSDLVELCCDAPASVAARRIRRRRRDGDASDATVEVAAAMRSAFHAWPSAHRIETDQPRRRSLAAALAHVLTAGEAAPGTPRS